jgi:hypothetical protein
MPQLSNINAKKTSTSEKKGKRKPADVGLTDKEKILVHALRDLFDPKGKKKMEELSPKGICASEKTTVKAATSSEKKTSLKVRGQTIGTSDRKSLIQARRVKREAKLSEKKVDKIELPKGNKCPSKVRRAEKRAEQKAKLLKIKGDGGAWASFALSRAEQTYNFPTLKLNKMPVLELPKRNTRRKGGSARLNESDLPVGVRELEVVEAFGLECLRLLRASSFEQLNSFPSYQGPNLTYVRKHVKTESVRRIKRKYDQAVKGLGPVSVKNRPEPSSLRVASAKKSPVLSEKKGKEVVVGEKTPNKKSKCQIRREQRRKQARDTERAGTAVKVDVKQVAEKSSVLRGVTRGSLGQFPNEIASQRLVEIRDELKEIQMSISTKHYEVLVGTFDAVVRQRDKVYPRG